MNCAQVKKALDELDEIINRGRTRPFPVARQGTSVPGIAFSHLRWMVQECHAMTEQVEHLTGTLRAEDYELAGVTREKLMRWLGFIQGALVDRGVVSIDEMRELTHG